MENMYLADLVFKVVVGFAIPYAVKSLSAIRTSIEDLNKNMAVLMEKDSNKEKDIEEVKEDLKETNKKLAEQEKMIIALQIQRGQND
jgi:peptidoglycan hydrolase CwlO-like protein